MMYVIALYIMLKAHLKQKDKSGRMYIFHPLYVSFKLKGYNAKIVGLLHDVVEDSDYTIEDLKHNSDLSRLKNITIEDEQRELKYKKALIYLKYR